MVQASKAPGAARWRQVAGRSAWALARSVAAAVAVTATLASLWFALTLLHQGGRSEGAAVPPAMWAVLLTVGVPLLLGLWRHPRNPGAALRTLTYTLPAWNGVWILCLFQMAPDTVARSLEEDGAYLAARRYGHTATQTRVLSALGQQLSAVAARSRTGSQAPPPAPPADQDALVVPFRASGASILVDVELRGPAGTASGRYVFDTGASYATMTRAQAAAIGVAVAPDATKLEFQTAAGPIQSPMVLLPSLRLGNVEIENLAVSVCDACASEEADGLLGLNVVRRFLIQMDYVRDRMVLLPRPPEETENRAYDVQAMTQISVVGPPDVWLGAVHWVLQVRNLSPRTIRDVVPAVRFVGGPTLRGSPIDRIPPGGSATTIVKGRVGRTHASFVLELARARW